MTGSDAAYTYFSATSDGLSLFAVTAVKVEVAHPSSTIDFRVSPEPFGSTTTAFLVTDAIYPTVVNRGTGEPRIKVTLHDENATFLFERSYNVPNGQTGFDDYNPDRALKPGVYRVKVWNGSTLLGVLELTVSAASSPATNSTVANSTQTSPSQPVTPSGGEGVPGYPLEAVFIGLILSPVTVLWAKEHREASRVVAESSVLRPPL